MTEPGTALERREETYRIARPEIPTHDEINRSWRLAKVLAESGAFPEAKDATQAFAVMLIGHDLGLTPTEALMGVHIVKGKPMVGYTLLGSFVKRIPGYDYRVREHTETTCTIRFTIDGKAVGDSTFSVEDAKRAGLVKDDSAWKKYPMAMVLARALSQGVRWYMPDATGGVPVYVEGEVTEAPRLTEGSGREAAGIALPPNVERVLERAAELGHAGLADRAAAEMACGAASPNTADRWAANAEAELDTYAQDHPIQEADVVEPIGEVDDAEARRIRRDQHDHLMAEAAQRRADGDEARAVECEEAAAALVEIAGAES